jgi:formylglycine-generating enzyme required for sulfatase activity
MQCAGDMALVPAGTFRMGASNAKALERQCLASSSEPEACALQAQRQRDRYAEKQVGSFCLDTHEVTYAALLRSLSSDERSHVAVEPVICSGAIYELARVSEKGAAMLAPNGGFIVQDGKLQLQDVGLATRPAAGISWSMALEYCRVLKKRLPTDVEWEYAARGPESRAYVTGERESWLHEDFGCPHRGAIGVGQRDPRCDDRAAPPVAEEDRAWSGVFSLAGSVNEWTSTSAGDDCRQESDCRVVKGGGHEDPAFFTRPATVFYARADCPWSTVGFRCAADPATSAAR